MKRLISMIFVAWLALCGHTKAATEPVSISIVTSSWDGIANVDGTGYYFDLIARIYPAPDWHVEVQFVPFSRAVYMLDRQEADLIFSVYPGDLQHGLLSQYPVEIDTIDAAVTAPIAANWRGIESLSHKRVQAMLSYRYDKLTSVPMVYEEGSNKLVLLNRLNAGQIDAVLDYKPDILNLMSSLSRPQSFIIIENVLSSDTFFAFANTAKGKRLKQHFDREHKRLIDSGEQNKLFSEAMAELATHPANE